MSGITHPAVGIVQTTEELWDDNPERAKMRAHLIVTRLIEAGYIEGVVSYGMACKKEGETNFKSPDLIKTCDAIADRLTREDTHDGCGDGPLKTQRIFEASICPGCGKPIELTDSMTIHQDRKWHLLCVTPSNEMDERRVPRFDGTRASLNKSSA